MEIHNIDNLFPNRDFNKKIRERSENTPVRKEDNVHISGEGRKQLSNETLIRKAKIHLNNLPDIRENKVKEVSIKIKNGYKLDSDSLAKIASGLGDNLFI